MAAITYILFFVILGRYMLCSWKAGVDPTEAIICLLYFPILILILISEGFFFAAIPVLAIAGLISFIRPVKLRLGWI